MTASPTIRLAYPSQRTASTLFSIEPEVVAPLRELSVVGEAAGLVVTYGVVGGNELAVGFVS